MKLIKKLWNNTKIRIGLIAFFVIVTSGLLYIKTQATYLLSPGPLSNYTSNHEMLGGVMSHADLARDCKHCHAPVHCVTDARCQECHMDIARDRNDVNTLHGRLPGVSRCQDCHPEHRGADQDLTEISFQNVDHYKLAGFSLEKHNVQPGGEPFTCSTCHTQNGKFIETIDCVTCHSTQDHNALAAHIEQYGRACSECHDGVDRMVNGFDHEPYFSLANGHAGAACADCHTQQHYVGLNASCSSCHVEPEVHAGNFGQDCVRCHTTAAWVPAELRQHTFALQHGDEMLTDCTTCHTGAYTSYTCSGCHEDDQVGQVHTSVQAEDINDCQSCHTTGSKGEKAATQPGQGQQTPGNTHGQDNSQPGPGENQAQNGSPENTGPQHLKPDMDNGNMSGKDE